MIALALARYPTPTTQDMLISWLDTREVTRFVGPFIEELHRIKSGGAARGDKIQQVGRRIDKLLDSAASFERAQRLNVYQKARLLTAVREGLASKHWSQADTEAIVQQLLLVRLQKRGR